MPLVPGLNPDFESLVALGRVSGADMVNKFGRNNDLDSGTEDLWDGGGTYTGFPTGAPEQFMAVSTSAGDTGVLTFQYLASSASTVWQTASVQLNGLTPVATGITGYRMHTAQYSSGSPTTFNAGNISIYHQVTTSNVFCVILAGRSQSNVCAYTVPAQKVGLLLRLFGEVKGTATAEVTFDLWMRALGVSPRLRRPNEAITTDRLNANIRGGILLPAGMDVKFQLGTTGNNLDVIGGFDIMVLDA